MKMWYNILEGWLKFVCVGLFPVTILDQIRIFLWEIRMWIFNIMALSICKTTPGIWVDYVFELYVNVQN